MKQVFDFLNFLTHEKRYSSHTVTAYQADLIQFTRYISETYQIENPGEVHHQHIRSWVVELLDQQFSNKSINRKLSTLKSFFRFLLKNHDIADNPMVRITGPKTEKRLPQFIKESQMETLFSQSLFADDFQGQRDRLIIDFFYHTGIRLSELINIKHQDIDHHLKKVTVLGKRNKERMIPLSNHLSDLIRKFLDTKKAKGFSTEQQEAFFITNTGKPLYPKFVFRTVNKYISMVSTQEKKSPHVLRHTFATHLLNHGADLNAIKEILGHANLAATQVYTHNTIDKLKKVYNQAHPRA